MRVYTLVRYLLGKRQDILQVAASSRAVWLGMVFVISAGFAREYDGEDLLHEPWHLALPLAASLLTSFLLFVLLETGFRRGSPECDESSSFFSRYRTFLGLYWMTAPLAWLYAVPVERFLDAADAVRTNLWLLGIVSVWRVLLMTRVVSVIYARSMAASFFLVMLFADSLALVVFWLTPLPILSVMGGIRLTESEQVIQATGLWVRILGTATWPIWLIGACTSAARNRGRLTRLRDLQSGQRQPQAISPWLWTLSALSVLIWIPILPFTQVEQINRRRVETDLRAGRVQEAIGYMSQRERSEFPPHWDPPPRIGYAETQPSLVDVLLHLERVAAKPWVQNVFREKLAFQSRAETWDYYGHAIKLGEMEDQQLVRYVELLRSLPEGRAMARYHQAEIQARLDPIEYGEAPEPLSENRRTSLEEILQLARDNGSEPQGQR